jgi:type IV fimbrial biogenesis protein FimT
MKNRTQTGFTLSELLTTLMIVGVALSLGVPNMQSFWKNSRMTAAANDLHSAFHLARTEASRTKSNITICGSTNPMAPSPNCDSELDDGWILFVDTDGDIDHDNGEQIIRRGAPAKYDIVINTPYTNDYFSFAPTGLGRGNITGTPPISTIVLCDARGNVTGGGGKSTARVLVVTPLGRAAVLADESQVAFHGGC